MRNFCTILALLLALQPLLMMAHGPLGGQADCARESTTAPACSEKCCSPKSPRCCCADTPEEVPQLPVKQQLDGNRLLANILALASRSSVIEGGFLTSSFETRTFPGGNDPMGVDLTHNERLALHCILRT